MQFARDTQFDHGQEVEAYGGNYLTIGTSTKLPLKAIVGFLIEVEVYTHDGDAPGGIGSMFDISLSY